MLEKVRPASSKTDHLFVGTDQYAHFTLSWDGANARFRNEHVLEDLEDNTARDSTTGSKCLVDPEGRVMALDFFEGRTTIIPLKQPRKGRKRGGFSGSELGTPHTIRIPEFYIRSSAFLYGTDQPEVVLLYEDGNNKVNLKTRVFEIDAKGDFVRESSGSRLSRVALDNAATLLIPVPQPPGL